MVEKKPEDEGVIFSSKYLNDSYKGKEFEVYLKLKPPAKKPEIKRSIYNSVWVWFLLCLGINFIAGDPIGFTSINPDGDYCQDPVISQSQKHQPSDYDRNEGCSR